MQLLRARALRDQIPPSACEIGRSSEATAGSKGGRLVGYKSDSMNLGFCTYTVCAGALDRCVYHIQVKSHVSKSYEIAQARGIGLFFRPTMNLRSNNSFKLPWLGRKIIGLDNILRLVTTRIRYTYYNTT